MRKSVASGRKNQRNFKKIWGNGYICPHASVTIGAVVSSVTNALKATGKALGASLKGISAKLGSMLPGLISQVTSFLFKTMGQMVSYLAEHTGC